VQADVQAFEKGKRETKQKHEQVIQAHRASLMKQIDEHKTIKHNHAMAPQEYMINKHIIEEVIG